MKRAGVVDSLDPIHLHVIRSGITYFGEFKEESLASSKLRWDVSSDEVKIREPFGYKNFFTATFGVERYAKLL